VGPDHGWKADAAYDERFRALIPLTAFKPRDINAVVGIVGVWFTCTEQDSGRILLRSPTSRAGRRTGSIPGITPDISRHT
jgi:hypothetical protein